MTMHPAPSTVEPQFTESLNFKVTTGFKARMIAQQGRLEMTQAAVARICLALGLEALERLSAEAEGERVSRH